MVSAEPQMEQFHAYGEGAQMFGWLDGSVEPPREACFEGVAGCGKTRMIGEWIKAACNMYPEGKGLVLRETRVSLNDSFLEIFENQVLGPEHPAVLGGPTRRHRTEYAHPALGAKIILGGMDNPTKLFSTEYDWIYFNECQETTKKKWESLHRAMRRTKMPFRVLLGDCNPEDEYHWLNQRMEAGTCHRIVGRFWDNPTFYDHESQQWKTLGKDYLGRLRENLSGPTLERLYHGRWVSAHGQVWAGYDPRVHLLDASVREENGVYWLDVDKWEQPVELVYFVGGQDIGHTDPGCAQVWGVDREGRAYRVAEIYQTQQDHEWWGQRWVEFYEEFPIRSIICDHDKAFIASLNRRIRGRGEDGMPGIARPAFKTRGRGEEMVGIDDVRVRLKPREDGSRGLYIVKGALRNPVGPARDPSRVAASQPCCLEQEIPSYVYQEVEEGKRNRDEPDPSCSDHACDTMRYVIRFLQDRKFGGRDERLIFPRNSLNDRLGFNKPRMRRFFSHLSRRA